MLPLVWMVSYTQQFQQSYPFYKLHYPNSSMNHFIAWQCFYFLQFLGLEFFFRGFMVHALKNRFGFYAIFIMMIPYCMIHFGKPWPETLGAIFAGIILGAMSLKSNSIWFGVLLHYSVAISMDLFSLIHQ
jgi:membrane protease YdiL (CAAX protease family)